MMLVYSQRKGGVTRKLYIIILQKLLMCTCTYSTCTVTIYYLKTHKDHTFFYFQPQNTRELCDSIVVHAQRYSPSIISAAEAIGRKFQLGFELLAKCHQTYNNTSVTIEETDTLGKYKTEIHLQFTKINYVHTDTDIESFVTYYKETFPTATFIPKLHILQKHTSSQMRRWGVAFGLMGELGCDSIHKQFNQLREIYKSIPDGVQKLRCMMKEHFIHIAPTKIAQQPLIKRRKLLDDATIANQLATHTRTYTCTCIRIHVPTTANVIRMQCCKMLA